MFGLGWSEMMVVGIVALIVVGPKDLPGLFRTIGQFTGKAKAMAREFSKAMEDAADQSGMKEISKTINAAANPQKFGVDKIREATGMSSVKDGSATAALSKERAEARDKIAAATGKAATERKALEAAAIEEQAAPVTKTAPTTKTVDKTAPAKKPVVKKPAAKSAVKPDAKKPVAKKPATKKPAAKKPTPKKTPAKTPKGDA